MSDNDALYDAFLNPGPEWRGKPFWAWNGRLDKDELLRQVHVMKEMGLGGFFMHSRVGLVTEYLGDDWFECINACADEAERLGMEAWLYDEDRWPSGTAGGLVTENPEHRMRSVRLDVVPGAEWRWPEKDPPLAVFACELDGLSYTGLRRVAPGDDIAPGLSVLVFTVEEMACSNFYNGTTYLDTMSRAATEAFLDSTHEKYVDRCGGRLGTSIRGIFTDEPHRGALMSSFGQGVGNSEWLAPWTPDLPERWHAAHGDDLLDRLPEIFLWPEGRQIHPTKWRYVELCLTLFLDHYVTPLDDWCREHGIALTGHFLHEDCLSAQVAMNGAVMRGYARMEVPGVDVLSEGNRNFWIAKQLQSVGRQLGQPWRMSELYGCTGWQMNLHSHKMVGDWQTLFGINLRCHHLSWFTMEGEAKRDFPASILHQSAWWRDYAAVETYFARLGLLLEQGEPVVDVLVIHPVESVWAQIHPGWCDGLGPGSEPVRKLERDFAELFHTLQGAQIDFDYGDEGLLAEHGRIDGNAFVVGKMRYRTVVVGGCTTIRTSTLSLLETFAAAGGTVLWAGEKPSHVDAEPKTLPDFGQRLVRGADLPGALLRAVQITGESASQVFVQARRIGDDLLVVALNVDREDGTGPCLLALDSVAGSVERWDLLTGVRSAVTPFHTAYGSGVPCDLPPGGEAVFLFRATDGQTLPEPGSERGGGVSLDGPFAVTLDEPNVLVLDTCDVILAGEGLGRHEILKADQLVRARFGLEARGGEMVQPWFAAKFHGEPPTLGRLTLRFSFAVEILPDGDLHLAVERPDHWEVRVNGVALDRSGDAGWWVDASLRKLPVPSGALRLGENVVEVEGDFRRDVDLEALFLLGGFGVRLDGPERTLTVLPTTLAVGDLCLQGLPFYTGCVTYHLDAPAGELTVPEVGGACLRVDGQTLPWPPYVADVSGGACDLTVVLTRRNAFGPLHLVPKVQTAYGPGHWVTGGKNWSDDYQLYPSGLLQTPTVHP